MPSRLGDVLLGHAAAPAQLNAPEALNIVFHFIGAVKRLLRDLAGGLLFHEPLVTDDGLVGDRPAHVVDSASTGDGTAARALVLQDLIRNWGHAHVKN